MSSKKGGFGGFLLRTAILGAAAYGAYKLANNEKVKEFIRSKREDIDRYPEDFLASASDYYEIPEEEVEVAVPSLDDDEPEKPAKKATRKKKSEE